MRHGDKVNNLGRTHSHRVALFKNMASALITHKRISTTLAKAKALKTFIEPLITKSKTNTTHSRRVVFSYLQNKEAVTELFEVISQKVANRPGGYVRVIKTGFRKGDGAETAMIELVDFNELYTNAKPASADGAKRRTRRGGKATLATGALATAATSTVVEESPVMEEPAEEIVLAQEVSEPAAETAVEAVETVVDEPAAIAEESTEAAAEEVAAIEEQAPAAEEAPAIEEAPAAEETPEADDNQEDKAEA